MSEPSSERDAVELLAEEFLERYRRGERPPLTEYSDAHPQLADRIRSLFPILLLAEQMDGQPRSGDTPALPKFLGEYRVIRELGRGGMGVVYEAVQESLGRHVALKVLPNTGLASATYRERFQREARAAARMHHTNIVPVFGVGEHEGTLYYAMQFIPGQGLDAVIRELHRHRGDARTSTEATETKTPLSSSALSSQSELEFFRTVARVGLQVAQALSYAHAQGIQHRDIKPSNLLIDAQSTVWVTDFGLAKADDEDGLTHTGDFVGTLRYMAPERFRGESTQRGDVYSLGVTLYEMLTLQPAFAQTDRPRLMEQVINQEPMPPRSIDRRIPRDLETIVSKAMAKLPADRYSSAELMADDLHRFLSDRPVRARPTPVSERVWRWCRRNPRVAGLLAVVAVLLLAILIGGPVLSVRLYEQRQAALEQLWSAHLARAKAQRVNDLAGRRFLSLESLDNAWQLMPSLKRDPARTLDLRNEYFACLSLADIGPTPAWDGYPPGSAAVCVDPAFQRYALGDEKGAIRIIRIGDGVELTSLPGAGIGAWALKFSPDGRYLAAGYHRKYQSNSEEFRVWEIDSRREVLQLKSQTGCGEADFSPDSRRVAFGRDKGTLTIHELAGGSKDYPVSALPNAIAFHPDGQSLAVALKRTVEIRNVATGEVSATRTLDKDVWALAWHPDGKRLAAGSGSAINLWTNGASQPDSVLRGHEQVVYALAFNRAGDLLASKAQDGTVRLWDVATQQQLVRAPSVYAGCTPLQFGPDDRQLGLGADGSRLWLWNVARAPECRTLVIQNPPASYQSLTGRFSRDGRWLVVGGNDRARVFDWAAGRMVTTIAAPQSWGVFFTPDGRQLITSCKPGLQRWQISQDSHGGLQFAGPESFGPEGPLEYADVNKDATTIVTHRRRGPVFVLPINSAAAPVMLGDHAAANFVAISPDGRHAATGSQFGSAVKIWETTGGTLLHELPIDSSAAVVYSPDGKWLVIGTEKDFGFYDAKTWQLSHAVKKEPENMAAPVSFTADGTLVAVRHAPSRLRLLDPATGHQLAELLSPGQKSLIWHALSPDGHQLAAAGIGGVIHVWDLQAVRRQLADRSIDW